VKSACVRPVAGLPFLPFAATGNQHLFNAASDLRFLRGDSSRGQKYEKREYASGCPVRGAHSILSSYES
jgi:hypothetical protein